MLPANDQYVNIHAHRAAAGRHEWVLRSLKSGEYPPARDPGAVYSVGLHPWELETVSMQEALGRVRSASGDLQVLAIGETGLDHAIAVEEALQMTAFRAQVEIARAAGLPVIIHAVKSYQQLIRFAREGDPGVQLIIHGYRGGQQLADDLLRAGFFLSFGVPLLQSEKVMKAFVSLPLERVFLETDEAKIPIAEVYEKGAALKKMPVEVLKQHMTEKTNQIFTGRQHGR
jgi:TatD DNase family protein